MPKAAAFPKHARPKRYAGIVLAGHRPIVAPAYGEGGCVSGIESGSSLWPPWTAYGRSAPQLPWPRLSRSFPITRHGSRKVITRRTGKPDRAYALAGYNWFGQE